MKFKFPKTKFYFIHKLQKPVLPNGPHWAVPTYVADRVWGLEIGRLGIFLKLNKFGHKPNTAWEYLYVRWGYKTKLWLALNPEGDTPEQDGLAKRNSPIQYPSWNDPGFRSGATVAHKYGTGDLWKRTASRHYTPG